MAMASIKALMRIQTTLATLISMTFGSMTDYQTPRLRLELSSRMATSPFRLLTFRYWRSSVFAQILQSFNRRHYQGVSPRMGQVAVGIARLQWRRVSLALGCHGRLRACHRTFLDCSHRYRLAGHHKVTSVTRRCVSRIS